MNGVSEFLFDLRCRGITVRIERGEFRFEAPESVTASDIERAKALRSQLPNFSRQLSDDNPARIVSVLQTEPAPLTFAQTWLWNTLELTSKCSYRVSLIATEVVGPLDTDCLRNCITQVMERHDSLRTRICEIDGTPKQIVDTRIKCDLETVDLSAVPAEKRSLEASRFIRSFKRTPIQLSTDPLFDSKLIRFGRLHHVFVMALDHLVSDGNSERILVHEVWSLYGQMQLASVICLPSVNAQLRDYAFWLHSSRSTWESSHGAYWRTKLAGSIRTRLFTKEGVIPRSHYGVFNLQFGESLSKEVREFSRRHSCTVVVTVLSIYSLLVSKWCGKKELVVPFITSDRFEPEVAGTIGCFACPLFLAFTIYDDDSFFDFLGRVIKEFSDAMDHCDHGLLSSVNPQPECLRSPRFNWSPLGMVHEAFLRPNGIPGLRDLRLQNYRLSSNSCDLAWDVEWDHDANAYFWDCPDEITGQIWFPEDVASPRDVARFGQELLRLAFLFTKDPTQRIETFRTNRS